MTNRGIFLCRDQTSISQEMSIFIVMYPWHLFTCDTDTSGGQVSFSERQQKSDASIAFDIIVNTS